MDRGRSLTPRPVVAELSGGLLSARVGELRVLLNREGLEREDSYSVGAVELYDLVGDPAELEECSGGRVGELEGVLRAISEWEARFPPLD
jgi:hypothetical protein